MIINANANRSIGFSTQILPKALRWIPNFFSKCIAPKSSPLYSIMQLIIFPAKGTAAETCQKAI